MEIDLEILSCFCDEVEDVLVRWEQLCFAFRKEDDHKEGFQELFRLAHNLKGGSGAVGLMSLADFVHKVEDGITLLRDNKVTLTSQITDLLLESHSLMSTWITGARKDPTFEVEYKTFASRYLIAFNSPQTAKTNLVSQTSESVPASVSELDTQVVAKTDSVVTNGNKNKIAKPEANANETIRISAQRLDHLIQTIGELSIHQSIMSHTKGEDAASGNVFNNSLHLSQKLTKELYDKALSLRMQPLQSVFQRLERNIIDLAKNMNKDVDVVVSGSEVELDKTVIEKIIDPLTHIVRNAIDHGVESKDERLQKNKKACGQINISAYQDAFGVVLTIEDDGKGLSSAKILEKAKDKGLIDANAKPTQEEIFQLIFLPGFSTAEKITDVSGRGVGMDVVRKTLEKLNGTIRIDSTLDKGTEFTITLPTSVSIVDSMIIKVANQSYVVPVSSVEEVIHISYDSLEQKNMYKLRNTVIPIYDLSVCLKTLAIEEKTTKSSLMVCKTGKDRIGFFIDKVMGQQQVVIRSLNENIDGAFGILGGTILGNGEPGLIIDIPGLAQHFIQKYKPQEAAA
jgi:two-component system chemotaxis sensor kinase CheA